MRHRPGLQLRSACLLTLLIAVANLQAADPLPRPAEWLPRQAVIVLEIDKPWDLLAPMTSPAVLADIAATPGYKLAASQEGFQGFLSVVKFMEGRFGTDWKNLLRKALGGGITMAVLPDGASMLFVDTDSPKFLQEFHGIILGIVQGEATKEGRADSIKSREYKGVQGWSFGDEEAHALIGNRLVLTNKPKALKAVLDWRDAGTAASITSLPAYQAAAKAVAGAGARAFINLETIKQQPDVMQQLSQDQNPFTALLFAGLRQAVRDSTWLALGMNVAGSNVTVTAIVDGKTPGADDDAAFTWPKEPGAGALTTVPVPRHIAGLSFYRDLPGFYSGKDELFPERTSGLIFFENMMGIFFSGRDITDEIMGALKPEIRFVVAEQAYDPAVGTPALQLPAFAAVFRLQDPDTFAEIAEEAWQKALGIVNFGRGQQAQPGLIIDKEFHGSTKYSVAYFRSSKEDDKKALPPHFNVRPSLACVKDYLILSSTEGLTRDLIDALGKEQAEVVKHLAPAHSFAELHGTQLMSILSANKEALISQNMLEKGHTREEAEGEMGVLYTALSYFKNARLTLGTRAGSPAGTLALTLQRPHGSE